MQIKRLLDDRELLIGERVFDAQGRYYDFYKIPAQHKPCK